MFMQVDGLCSADDQQYYLSNQEPVEYNIRYLHHYYNNRCQSVHIQIKHITFVLKKTAFYISNFLLGVFLRLF